MLITFGATEGIAAALLALCDPGDEVVVLEPYYDSYAACIAFSGASRRAGHAAPAGLRARPWTRCGLRSARGPGLLLLNSPHNPTGRVLEPCRARGRRRRVLSSVTWCASPTRSTSTSSTTASTSRWPRSPGWRSGR